MNSAPSTDPLANAISVLSGFPFPSSQFTEAGTGKPLIRIRNLIDSQTETNFVGYFDKAFLIHWDNILIGMDGDFNVVRWKGPEALLNQRVCKVTPSNNTIDGRFLFWWLQPHIQSVHRRTPQTTVRHLSVRDIYSIPKPILSPKEQAFAAKVMDTADEAIAKTEAVIAKLRQVRTGLIHDLLTCGLDENGYLRDPIAHPEQFQETSLGLLPTAWDVVALGTALSMQAGSGLTGDDITEAGPYPVYGGNGQRGFTARFTHEGRFVLIGRQGALCGNIAVASGKFFATEHAIVCTPIRPISAGWLACYLERMNLNRFSEASAQPGLSVQKISYKEIALPFLDEQVQIESRIDELDRLLESETSELQKLTQLKSGLMDDLLTGRVRVPEIR